MTDNQSQFWNGVRYGMPATIAAAPFGLLFGALAVENGLTIYEATLMSAIVFAGASQMVGIELFGQKIEPWLIVFSVFAVNFRHVLYSATMSRLLGHMPIFQKAITYFFLTDPQFALAEQRVHSGQRLSFVWYLGVALPLYVAWVVEAAIGGLFGNIIEDPYPWGISFLLSVYFLALLMTFRKRSKFVPVAAASAIGAALAYQTVGSPWHVSIGAMCGVLVAVCWPIHNKEQTHG